MINKADPLHQGIEDILDRSPTDTVEVGDPGEARAVILSKDRHDALLSDAMAYRTQGTEARLDPQSLADTLTESLRQRTDQPAD